MCADAAPPGRQPPEPGWVALLRTVKREAAQRAADVGLSEAHAATWEVAFMAGFRFRAALRAAYGGAPPEVCDHTTFACRCASKVFTSGAAAPPAGTGDALGRLHRLAAAVEAGGNPNGGMTYMDAAHLAQTLRSIAEALATGAAGPGEQETLQRIEREATAWLEGPLEGDSPNEARELSIAVDTLAAIQKLARAALAGAASPSRDLRRLTLLEVEREWGALDYEAFDSWLRAELVSVASPGQRGQSDA